MSADDGQVVLDASAVLALLRAEHGADQVEPALQAALLSTVNATEVAQKISYHGSDGAWALGELRDLGVNLVAFTTEDALAAAALWPHTRTAGLSLADRACLALARRMDCPALTADQAWKDCDLDIEIRLIR